MKLFSPSLLDGPTDNLPEIEGCRRDEVLVTFAGRFNFEVSELWFVEP